MIFKTGLSALFLILSVFAAHAQDNPIIQRMAAFTEAYNAKDAAAIGQFYAEDGALLPPQSKALVGREPIAAHYAKAFGQGVSGLVYKVIEIRQLGPAAALEIGEAQVKISDQTVHSRSMHVWMHKDGTWFLSRDMYHVLGLVK